MIISLIVPCYNEECTVDIFYSEVLKIEHKINAEIEFIFINDGSQDATLDILKDLHQRDARVHYISFSRNFGKEAALLAGLEMASGDYVATMDVDLQDPPSLLPEMIEIITGKNPEGEYDCVATRRCTRKGEPLLRSFFSRAFYRIINRISSTQFVDGARDYRLMNRKVVNAIIGDREYNRFSKGIFSWVGFRTKWIAYDNITRSAGLSKWSFFKLFKYSVEGILAYSTLPLYITSCLGILMCFLSFFVLLFIIFRALIFGDAVAGWPSMVSIMVFLNGTVLLCVGIIGLYISKIYLETKKRQIYIIKEKA